MLWWKMLFNKMILRGVKTYKLKHLSPAKILVTTYIRREIDYYKRKSLLSTYETLKIQRW